MEHSASSRYIRRGLLTACLALFLILGLTRAARASSSSSEHWTLPADSIPSALSGNAGLLSSANERWMLTLDGVPTAVSDNADLLSSVYQSVVDSYRTNTTVALTVDNEMSILRISAQPDRSLPTEPDQIAMAFTDALTVETTEQIIQIDKIPYNTVTVTDDTMYEDESVIQEGLSGLEISQYTTSTVNGVQVSATEPEVTTLRQPRDTVVTVGTLEHPEFIWPAHGLYTGSYGIDTINGAYRKHDGIDINSAGGTNIVAARGGTVVYAGWNSGGYGNLVVIQHDNGTHTYYAHNAAIYVSVGDTVEQGELIARMGSTGRATGVHCHFEIRLGEYTGLFSAPTTNPLNYLDLADL